MQGAFQKSVKQYTCQLCCCTPQADHTACEHVGSPNNLHPSMPTAAIPSIFNTFPHIGTLINPQPQCSASHTGQIALYTLGDGMLVAKLCRADLQRLFQVVDGFLLLSQLATGLPHVQYHGNVGVKRAK